MKKISKEEEKKVSQQDIDNYDIQIKYLENELTQINSEEKNMYYYKIKLDALIRKYLYVLKKERCKIIFNFQKRNDHGFFSLKTSNEELAKIDDNIKLVSELLFKIDLSFFYTNSLEYSILRDLSVVNFELECLLDEINDKNFLKTIVEKLDKTIKNFKRNREDIDNNSKSIISRETIGLKELNQEAVKKHIISVDDFEIIKEYLEFLVPNNIYSQNVDDIAESVKHDLYNHESNSYFNIYSRLCEIESNFDSIDEKYKKNIKNVDLDKIKEAYYKLYFLKNIINIIENIINRQNNILKNYIKKNLFSGYIKYLKDIILKAKEISESIESELVDFNITSYLELFEYIDNIRIYNNEISLYKEKTEQATVDTDIINYNNKITALNIKLRRAESNLLNNEYYK